MRRRCLLILCLLCLLLGLAASGLAQTDLPSSKQTILGLYLTAKEAFSKWHVSPEKVVILDVRTPEEYIFVGHAPMALNIPVRLFSQKLTMQKKRPVLENNPAFVSEIKQHYKVTDKLLVMCRSGGRSAVAVNLLAKAGFKEVYNIVDGFEGDVVKDPQSYYNGKRVRNGWKNSGVPWTYRLDPNLMYQP